SENGNGTSILDEVYYVKRTATSGDWAGPFYVRGKAGPPGTGILVAVTDETSPITVGVKKVQFRVPAMTMSMLRCSLRNASSSGDVVVDLNVIVGGVATSRLSTK